MKTLVVDQSKCAGCRICELWCSLQHNQVANPAFATVKIFRDHANYLCLPVTCTQCVNAPCVADCPKQALSQDEKTGGIMVDEEKCIGCRKCLKACPNAAISFHPQTRKAVTCDLCGGQPVCVTLCPMGALQYIDVAYAHRPAIEKAVEKHINHKTM